MFQLWAGDLQGSKSRWGGEGEVGQLTVQVFQIADVPQVAAHVLAAGVPVGPVGRHPRVHIPPEFRAGRHAARGCVSLVGRPAGSPRAQASATAQHRSPVSRGGRKPRRPRFRRGSWTPPRKEATSGWLMPQAGPGPGGYDLSPAWQQRSLSSRLRPAQSSPTQSSPTQSSSSAPGLDKRFRVNSGDTRGTRTEEPR